MKLFKGQVVHVKATVQEPEPDYDGEVQLHFEGTSDWYFVHQNDIIHGEPAPLDVGDLVTWGAGRVHYTILCIDDGLAFLRGFDDRTHYLHDVSDLRRAD